MMPKLEFDTPALCWCWIFILMMGWWVLGGCCFFTFIFPRESGKRSSFLWFLDVLNRFRTSQHTRSHCAYLLAAVPMLKGCRNKHFKSEHSLMYTNLLMNMTQLIKSRNNYVHLSKQIFNLCDPQRSHHHSQPQSQSHSPTLQDILPRGTRAGRKLLCTRRWKKRMVKHYITFPWATQST